MIPKIIHYTWFSGEPFPEIIQKCINSWHKFMPEYEYRLWDYDAIKDIDSVWLKECLAQRKWAFAADFVRTYAIEKFGGIYLDTDVLVYQSFNKLLNDRMFIGREGVPYIQMEKSVNVYLTSHCFGAEPHHPFLKLNLEYYKGRHFVTCDSESVPRHLRLNMLMMPYIQSELAKIYGYDASLRANKTQHLDEGLVVYPDDRFGLFGGMKETENSYGRHLAAGSWREFGDLTDNTRYSVWYKIHWRIVAAFRWFVKKCGYLTVKY